ncbi:MAG TPA: undecaprenyl-phosphate galactose phosphotransferase WbaP, partial [Anaerolineales bacterium]|nr:undecaprenyl-phosphate galactose phosphotransferase WbaP [Anaerolineales bacterium]
GMLFETNSRLWMVGFLIASDLFGLFISILVACQIRQLPGDLVESAYIKIFRLLAITLVILFRRNGLYPGIGTHYVEELKQIVSSVNFAYMVMLGITFILKTTSIYSRLVLVVSWFLSLVSIPLCRYFLRQWMIRFGLWGEPTAIIGDFHKVLPMVEHFRSNPQLGLRPVAIIQDDQCSCCTTCAHGRDAVCSIKTHAHGFSLQTALILITDLNDIDRLVERFRTIFPRVILVKDKNGRYGLNNLEVLDFSHILGLQVKNNQLDTIPQVFKRLIDLVGSFLGLLVLAPLMGLVAVGIMIDSPGRIFYRQMRMGRDGRTFKLLKFRTMHIGAGQILADALARDPALKVEWDQYQKLKKDPRITRLGKFLRKFSLDELPQLWNIVRGEMSLVGPRPILPDQRDMYGDAFECYVQVTPGMTGLWQVSGRNQTTFVRRAELDHEYIQSWSFWLDIFILFKTIKVVFWEKSAY